MSTPNLKTEAKEGIVNQSNNGDNTVSNIESQPNNDTLKSIPDGDDNNVTGRLTRSGGYGGEGEGGSHGGGGHYGHHKDKTPHPKRDIPTSTLPSEQSGE